MRRVVRVDIGYVIVGEKLADKGIHLPGQRECSIGKIPVGVEAA